MSLTQNSLNNGAKWGVMWMGKKSILEKKFDDDFAGALDLYLKLKQADRKLVTLRCVNVGFPPPDHILHHEQERWEIVRRRGKKFKRKVIDVVDLMHEYNAEGWWHCPYCIKLRRFVQEKDHAGRLIMACPVCGVTNYNWHVRRWNPQAKTLEYRATTRRTSAKSIQRRKRAT